MTQRIARAGLQVTPVIVELLEEQICPGTGQAGQNRQETPDSGIYPPLPGGDDPRGAERSDRDPADASRAAQTRQPAPGAPRSASAHTGAGTDDGLEPAVAAQPGQSLAASVDREHGAWH